MRNKISFKLYSLFVALTCALLSGCSEEVTYYDPVKFPEVEIRQVGSSNEKSVVALFTPDVLTSYFVYAIGTEADLESFEKGTLTSIRKQMGNEPLEYTFEYLDPDNSYVIFARGYNANDEPGSVSSVKVKTFTESFSVKVQFVLDKSVGFTVAHTDEFYKFHCYFGKPGEAGEFEKLADADSDELSVYTERTPEYSQYYFDLTPDTEYVFYVRGYDRSNTPTKTFEVPVVTKVEDSCAGIYDFKINTLDLYLGNFTYTFNDKTTRSVMAIEEVKSLTAMLDSWQGNIYEMLKSWSDLGSVTDAINNTNKVFTMSYYTPHLLLSNISRSPFDYPFTVYVLLYDENGPCGIDRVKYATPAFNPNAGEADVDIKVTNIANSEATYTFTPNEHTNCFFFETFYAKYIDEGINYEGVFQGIPTDEYLLKVLKTKYFSYGGSPVTYRENTTGYEGMDLYVIAAPINENGLVDGTAGLKRLKYTAK